VKKAALLVESLAEKKAAMSGKRKAELSAELTVDL
jgi:hypothetical protein